LTGTDISPPDPSPAKQPFEWRLFAAGLVLLIVAAGSALPFMYTLQTITEGESSPSVLALFGGQVLLEGTPALALGLYLGRRVGLGFTLIPFWMRREPVGRRSLHILQLATVVAILSAVGVIGIGTIVLLAALVFGLDPAALADIGALSLFEQYPALWKWLLVSLHAGIAEEIFFRMGLLTLFSWLGALLWRHEGGYAAQPVFWGANLIAGLAFGFAHLFGSMPYPKIPVIMARIVVQNTALGLVLGWLYRRWGLESAMLAHFLVDVVLYVVLVPSLQSQKALWVLAALASLVIALTWALRGLRKRARGGIPVDLVLTEQ
jgi:membrane protease YdiL (CAAX protease family)